MLVLSDCCSLTPPCPQSVHGHWSGVRQRVSDGKQQLWVTHPVFPGEELGLPKAVNQHEILRDSDKFFDCNKRW